MTTINVMQLMVFTHLVKVKNTIVVTADGGGDGSNGTIWINKK